MVSNKIFWVSTSQESTLSKNIFNVYKGELINIDNSKIIN